MKLSTKSTINYNIFIITIKGTASIKILNKKNCTYHKSNVTVFSIRTHHILANHVIIANSAFHILFCKQNK